MPDNIEKENKRYYTIGEVADMFNVTKSQIRFWESEFDLLKPHKNSKGDRRFTPKNVDQIQKIHHLLKERGFTINGAKQEIKREKAWKQKKKATLKKLEEIRTFLVELQKNSG